MGMDAKKLLIAADKLGHFEFYPGMSIYTKDAADSIPDVKKRIHEEALPRGFPTEAPYWVVCGDLTKRPVDVGCAYDILVDCRGIQGFDIQNFDDPDYAALGVTFDD
jgi:hypothetical protein